MRTLLTFGDSNTHGTRPIEVRGEMHRHGRGVRWPTVAHAALGADGWHLVEEGLPGRTTQFRDPVMGNHMDGREGLKMALASHGPVDVLTIMLGTNDLKMRYAAGAETIRSGIAALLDLADTLEMQARHPGLRILLICPPPVMEQGPLRDEFRGGRGKGLALPALYQALATDRGHGFLDAGEIIGVSPVDGVHFDADAHQELGQAVAGAIRELVAG